MPTLPGVNHLNAVRAREKAGFWLERQGRRHIVMTNGHAFSLSRATTPVNAMTMGNIVRDAGLTVDEFRRLL